MHRAIFSVILAGVAALPTSVAANDWEKFYRPMNSMPTVPASGDPETVPSTGDFDRDAEAMWRRGYAPIGFTSFSTDNGKTSDAVRLAKKLKARFLIIRTNLTSSSTTSVPLTLPTTQTSYTSGTANAYGSGGYASGTYSGTTTTYGTKTTYIPITVERFDKLAVFFQEVPRVGMGIYARELTADEMIALDTRKAIAVRFVRDGSPAYAADIFPGDIITHLNGQAVDPQVVQSAVTGAQPIKVHLFRKGQPRDLEMTIAPDWQPKAIPAPPPGFTLDK